MRIQGSQHLQGAQQVNGPQAAKPTEGKPIDAGRQNIDIQDTVDISEEAMQMQAASGSSDIRWDKVNAIRAQIEAGTYETPDKLEQAIDRLLDDIA